MAIRHDPALGCEVAELRHEGLTLRVAALLADRYEVHGVLAAGGFGVIYQARDRRLFGKRVLVKANRYEPYLFRQENDQGVRRRVAEQRLRLDLERRLLLHGQLRRIAGVPLLLDWVIGPSPQLYGPHRGEAGASFTLEPELWQQEPHLVLQLLAGRTLEAACADVHFRANLLGNCKQLILQVGRVLADFHAELLHRGHRLAFVYQDLKPGNVILTPEGRFVLIDFGSFAVRDGTHLVEFNLRVSTPPYRAPELDRPLSSEEAITPAADVFSLGATVLHMLRGGMPQDAATGAGDYRLAGLELAPAWQSWLERALKPEVRQRFATMEEAIRAAHELPTPPVLRGQAGPSVTAAEEP